MSSFFSETKHIPLTSQEFTQQDPHASERKKDHIDLALRSQIQTQDDRFFYEPLLAAHPMADLPEFSFLGKVMRMPLWISSMTGGTGEARLINHNLAKACQVFGLGMGLGSTRMLLHDDTFFDDFNLRPVLGAQAPFFANLGIAQVEKLLSQSAWGAIESLILSLQADGLIIHVNPLQEWLQPEGDRIQQAPIDTIRQLLQRANYPIIVKEVGQGMGPESLRQLMQLPLAAIEFAAQGGTNFSQLELHRGTSDSRVFYQPLVYQGHTAHQMVDFVNHLLENGLEQIQCRQFIISGGIKDFLDGFYHIRRLKTAAVYGQGSALLPYARESYESLHQYLEYQKKGLQIAQQYLHLRKPNV